MLIIKNLIKQLLKTIIYYYYFKDFEKVRICEIFYQNQYSQCVS